MGDGSFQLLQYSREQFDHRFRIIGHPENNVLVMAVTSGCFDNRAIEARLIPVRLAKRAIC